MTISFKTTVKLNDNELDSRTTALDSIQGRALEHIILLKTNYDAAYLLANTEEKTVLDAAMEEFKLDAKAALGL